MALRQFMQNIMIKHFTPQIILRSVKYVVDHTIGVTSTQLTHKDIPFSNVKTLKLTIGGVGVAGCDFNFATAANTDEQVIDLGAVIPALARVLDIKTVTEAVFTGATTLVAETGKTSSGNEFIASASIYAKDAITAQAHAAALNNAPAAAASHVYVAATPGANWALVTAGKVAVYITYLEV